MGFSLSGLQALITGASLILAPALAFTAWKLFNFLYSTYHVEEKLLDFIAKNTNKAIRVFVTIKLKKIKDKETLANINNILCRVGDAADYGATKAVNGEKITTFDKNWNKKR